MDPNSQNPSEPKPKPKRARGAKRRPGVIEFEFAKESAPPSPSAAVTPSEEEPPKSAPVEMAPSAIASPALSPVPAEEPSDSFPLVRTELSPIYPVSKSTYSPSQPRTTMSNSPIKPTTITDFKRNVDQQKKEQKSVNNILATITYVVLIGLIIVTGLAGFGAHQFWMRLNDQATSITTLDQKYDAAVTGLSEDAKRSKDDLDKMGGQIARQQEQMSVLRASLEKALADARTDRAGRAHDVAVLQRRISDLENRSGR